MFPNQHAVYLHDTPSRNLFTAERRAFSHGCVRVDQPFRLADVVLGAAWTESRLRSLIGKGERTINLPERLPVHLTYLRPWWTSTAPCSRSRTFTALTGGCAPLSALGDKTRAPRRNFAIVQA